MLTTAPILWPKLHTTCKLVYFKRFLRQGLRERESAFRKSTPAVPDHYVTIPVVFVHVTAVSVASSLMHQNPQCLCSSSSRPLPEWRNLSELRAPVLVFVAVHRSPTFAARGWRMWKRERTWVCVPTPLGISPVSVNLSGPPDSGAKATCEWDQRINLTVAFVFLFLALLSSLCCSSAVKQTPRSRRRNAAVSWD